MRVVIDTNIWISGLLWGSAPNKVVRLARAGEIQALVSDPILKELARAFCYPKLQAKLQQLRETPDTLLLAVQEVSQLCDSIEVQMPDLRDPKDAMILGTAIAGSAQAIVTGDQDLLVLKEYSRIPILLPQLFLDCYFPED